MKGDRYGNVVKVTKSQHRMTAGVGLVQNEIAHVLMDKSNKVLKVDLDDCEVVG